MPDATFVEAITAVFGERVRPNEPLSGHTTARIGGPAELWLPVNSAAELVTAIGLARQYRLPFFVLGGGANLLVSDAGIAGLVLANRAGAVDFPPVTPGDTPATVRVESGVILPNLVRRCAQHGLSGLEWAIGVPGTVGGAVVNNAGAYGSDLAASLRRVELLSPQGERQWQPVEWLEYGYRTSRLKRQPRGEWVVLAAELGLAPAPSSEIMARQEAFNQRRKQSQPAGATMGSMFKNPPGDYAGRLIEAAGLKGHQVGQARISPGHANFFQNLGQATAAEMVELIRTAQSAVFEKFGIELELEIELVGQS
jgi:UDP-N-acetylmuramate dehydrogenase